MNKREARDIVGRMTANSLRTLAKSPSKWAFFKDLPGGLTEAGREKVKAAMLEMADKVAPKEGVVIEQEPE